MKSYVYICIIVVTAKNKVWVESQGADKKTQLEIVFSRGNSLILRYFLLVWHEMGNRVIGRQKKKVNGETQNNKKTRYIGDAILIQKLN